MNIILAFLAGLFFASSIAGWICAHVSRCELKAQEAAKHYLGLQCQQAIATNNMLAARIEALTQQIREMGDDDTAGDEWKNQNGNNN